MPTGDGYSQSMTADPEQVRRLVDSSIAQGFPATVTDPVALATIAAIIGHAVKPALLPALDGGNESNITRP